MLLLHHEGKGARTNIMHVGVGSIGIMGAARSALFCGEHPETEGRYVMVHAKASEEARAGSAAYLLPRHELPNGAASVRLEFDGMADVDALAVVNGATHQSEADRGALAEAVEFLETYLSDGPAPKADVLKAARGRRNQHKRRAAPGGGSVGNRKQAASTRGNTPQPLAVGLGITGRC